MDDFEYSVEISDRDWQCFFMECEECNLLPPSLAGLDDSGMSDLDDTASMLAKRVQKRDPRSGFSESGDGPPDREGPPVQRYLGKQSGGGMASVLSGSEEDIHLQSVNMFFERLRNLTEAERPVEPSQGRAGKNAEPEEEELQCRGGKQARSSTLPRNTPKLNSPPARGETAVGKETVKPVVTVSSTNTMKQVKPGLSFSLEPAASDPATEPGRLAFCETEVFITEAASAETRAQPRFHSLTTQTATQAPPPLGGAEKENFPTSQGTLSSDLLNTVEMLTGPGALQPDATSTSKTATQESSPSTSIRRKRRKKRRLSMEPVESGFGCERQVSGRRGTDDSEEEPYTWRGGSEGIGSGSPAARASSRDLRPNEVFLPDPPCGSRYSPESTVRQGRSEAAGWATAVQAVTALSHPDDAARKALIASSNVATRLQPCMKSQAEEFIGLNKYCWLPCSAASSEVAKLETPGGPGGRRDARAESRQRSNEVNHVHSDGEREQGLSCSAAKVKSVTHSRLDLTDPGREVSQDDNQSVAKSVTEAEDSGRTFHPVCQGGTEQQQQLDTDRFSSAPGSTRFPVCDTGSMSSDAHDTPPSPPISGGASCTVTRGQLAEGCNDSSTSSRCDVLLEKPKAAAGQLEPHMKDPCPSIDSNPRASEDVLTSPSDFTPLSSCCTLSTGSVSSLSNENISDVSASFCSSVRQNEPEGQVDRKPLMVQRDVGADARVGPERRSGSDSAEPKCDVGQEVEDVDPTLEANHTPEKAPDPNGSIFTMSSFWSEMEKLTINDILGLRLSDTAAAHGSLPPLPEHEEAAMLATSDSGVFTQLDESKLEPTSEYTLSAPVSVPSSFGSVMTLDSSSSRSVLWESEAASMSPGADSYTENLMLASASGVSRPSFSGAAQTCLRKISKNVSVHNLHALESQTFRSSLKPQRLAMLDQGGSAKVRLLPEDVEPSEATDSSASSLTDGYRTSIVDLFRYFFGAKEPPPTQPADTLPTLSADGKSVPETYDLFFSDFDTESFFCPLFPADEPTKDELVPIFSCSRSANRNLQFPEAYDYFFPSSSSDDSSVESDDENNSGPVRVVSRFTQKTNTSAVSVDVYDDFFTDKDLGQNFIWKDTLSFRNFNLKSSTAQKSLVPVRSNSTSLRTIYPSNVLGNPDVVFPDPLLYHLEQRISKQLTQQPFTYEDLHTAVSNPRLDAPFLPLRQSDMCLVCIAFASWVLKTANPQAGDAWKAVVLANVSALSAIRYLRKYVRLEAAAGEKKPNADVTSGS